MAKRQLLLSGEHATLPLAEVAALLAVHEPQAKLTAAGVVAEVATDDPSTCDAALARAALAWEWGEPWAEDEDTPAGLARLSDQVRARATGHGSAAVRSERRGRDKSPRVLAVERGLGTALKEAGHAIDLEAPDFILYAWMLEGRIHVGRRIGVADRSRYEERVADKRRHFSPIGLHPRRAAALVHLCRAPVGGVVYDPFCGTGSLVLEAALDGYEAWGSDIDPWMVQGTLQALADDGPAPLAAHVFVADVAAAPDLVPRVDGVAADLPYGRASGTDGEGVERLYPRALEALARMLRPGARAVLGHARPELLADAERFGFRVAERHAEYTHKNLTRHFAVLERA